MLKDCGVSNVLGGLHGGLFEDGLWLGSRAVKEAEPLRIQ